MKKLSPWVIFGIVLVVIAIIVFIVLLLLSEAEEPSEIESEPMGSLRPERAVSEGGTLHEWVLKSEARKVKLYS